MEPVDAVEAETVRTIYNLYIELGSVREVKAQADRLDLRSRRRERAGGRVSGGTLMDRGHIYHLLSNPLYAGRIRHKGKVHPGQHPAIIDPELWERVQVLLQEGAAKGRGRRTTSLQSPLAGKLFDETGDRLTPSHSRKQGKRLRYYISRRLVTDRSGRHPDAWRLPADQLEGLVRSLIVKQLSRPDAAARLVQEIAASEVERGNETLAGAANSATCLGLVQRIDLKPGAIRVQLDAGVLAAALTCVPDRLRADALITEALFRMRRRGVEVKLHLGDAPAEVDRRLVQNIARARRWLDCIFAGQTYSEIAEAEGTSKRRVQDIVDLALLAPDVLNAIVAGEQPVGLTSDYLIKTGFPALWSEQRVLFGAL